MSTSPGNTNPVDARQTSVPATEYIAPPPLSPEEIEEPKNTPEGEEKDALWKKVNARKRGAAGADTTSAVAPGETPEQRLARETAERRAKFGIDTLETAVEPQRQSDLIDGFL